MSLLTRKGTMGHLLSLVFPPRCIVCGTLDTEDCLCVRCLADIAPMPSPACPRCGLSTFGPSCAHCSARSPAFALCRSAGAYEGVLQVAVHHLKYRDRPQLAQPLAPLILKCLQDNEHSFRQLNFDAIVPVPMHPTRKRQRGYNQAERLAQCVADALQIPLSVDALRRQRRTKPQVGLPSAAREKNLKRAFRAPDTAFDGMTILLVDDVTTTGSTLHECAAALKASGAREVYAVTLAGG